MIGLAKRILKWVFALYLCYLPCLYLLQGRLIYPGVRLPSETVAKVPKEAELIRLKHAHGESEVVFLPAPAVVPVSSIRRPLVIFAHGNNELIDFWFTRLNGFRQRGMHVLLVEYPGYGRSAGEPSEQSITDAMTAAYDWAANDVRVDSSQIGGFGMSLGGGAIGALVAKRSLNWIVLQSTFPSLAIFTERYLAPSWLLRDHFATEQALVDRNIPVLIIHGKNDGLIDVRYAEQMAKVLKRSRLSIFDCGHVCWDTQQNHFWQDFDSYLRELVYLN